MGGIHSMTVDKSYGSEEYETYWVGIVEKVAYPR